MLSSVFLPWLLLPFQSKFACGVPPIPLPSSCPAEGEEAVQVSLWQVVTHHTVHASNQPITYMGMLPVGMAAITLALLLAFAHRRVRLVRLGYVSALVLGVATQGVITALIGSLSSSVIISVTNRSLLLALPYLVDTFLVLGGLSLFVTPPPHRRTGEQISSMNS
jgi:hypothetical protein